jgi:nucleoside-diphosphate-sugar epimerase
MEKVLVTGNLGYIGSVLTEVLQSSYDVSGYDIGFYEECLLQPGPNLTKQINKDIRDIEIEDLIGFDAVVHLAALSNDPLGEFNPDLTREINYQASVDTAVLAKKAGVKKFIYMSSQSMYGISKPGLILEEDSSEKNPVTEYAITKWQAEQEINELIGEDFIVISLRPSTVFGASPRLRCDIVFNNLISSAYTSGEIVILSDGSPWRPVVHIKDVALAVKCCLSPIANKHSGRAFNVGIENGNFQVKDLAEAASKAVPGCKLVFKNEHSDPRTYSVSFKRILGELDGFQPQWNLSKGGEELITLFNKSNFSEEDFNGSKCNRLEKLKELINAGTIDTNLRKK